MSGSIDRSKLDSLAAQMGGTESLSRILGLYGEKLPREVEELLSAHRADDLAALQAQAHRLKSSSAQLGATRLGVLLAGLEQSARDGDAEAGGRILAEVASEAASVGREIEELSL